MLQNKMSDRQYLAYMHGRIEVQLELSNAHRQLRDDFENLFEWIDEKIDDDSLTVVENLEETDIPGITDADVRPESSASQPLYQGKVREITVEDVTTALQFQDYDGIPDLTEAILETCNCTKSALAKLLDIDNAAINQALGGRVYPYVEKAFQRVLGFPIPLEYRSESHIEAAELGMQCGKTEE